jgi:tRNA(Leu) C34 or U34 (ribose-2'-O)-methylase TrmL
MISKSYFSGFCLKDEEELFDDYRIKNDFTVSGFSYGAIKAFEEVLNAEQRVDKLQLFSPAFFQLQDKKFKRMQLMFFKKDELAYCNNFLENITYPSSLDCIKYFTFGTYEQLDELLNYEWSEEKLQALVEKGTKIEVYLGADDKIFDTLKAKYFFAKYATVYYIKNVGHILNK